VPGERGPTHPLETKLLPGAAELLSFHARELPQRDDLCGAFCGALALRAAGIEEHDGEPLDQDAVALAAGSVICTVADPSILPAGEGGRRDYRLELPRIEDIGVSGTTAEGVLRALRTIGAGRVEPIPFSGPWTPATLDSLFDAAAALERPAALVANLATHHLWGGRPDVAQLIGYLLTGADDGPPPDWRVGHFACVVARTDGPAGRLYMLADTYPALGDRGVHLQPRERLTAAIAREDMPAGGVIALVAPEEAARLRAAALAAGLHEGLWDNGTAIVGAG